MASVEECRTAIGKVSDRIMEVDEARRRKHIVDRTVSVLVSDLDTMFVMRLSMDGLVGVTDRPAADPGERAQVRITTTSDDLIELAEGRLDFAKALFSGRVKLDASLSDMMRMRKLL
ncbi:SCP2 sterol-binding domain-containing protein [Marinactinospora thermotolerans]|uniref:SCP-2 sterol transfer family protein n=1 Tax=Marinactinospora thermotolerans DSM 45154 TaxID=1122192 RepID=A0A1T4S0V4_9ACTN|nr:SCP2 sterol-binding domain-containing protein [Marinactinospora thermotolerans]SKA21874.1 SCP-2 sterol transfer family protein [Marinactinospora thermotolerans DSM 45154]